MPKFKDDIEWVKNLVHSIAVANGHDDPAGYADKVAAIHAAKEAEPETAAEPDAPSSSATSEQASTEGEGNGAT